MDRADYVVVGASHAGLEALRAIRAQDATASAMLLTRDARLPYSPTVLPYVVSGRSRAEAVALRTQSDFDREGIEFRPGTAVAQVEPAQRRVRLSDGSQLGYGKLLLATGSVPVLPPLPGLVDAPVHVLRSMDDALRLKAAARPGERAVVLGAGLVGLHGAENLAKAGMRVTVVELRDQVLPGYFDREAAAMVQGAFEAGGVRVLTGRRAEQVRRCGAAFELLLDDGSALPLSLLLVGAGVRPALECVQGSGIAADRGLLVDRRMRTGTADIWAAGDVAQAPRFGDGTPVLSGTVPNAVEQGRVAGMAMAGDPACRDYAGSISINTYRFFGQQALSVGSEDGEGAEAFVSAGAGSYLKIVLRDNRLQGIFSINRAFDPGIMWNLILREVDLGPVRERFIGAPQETARVLMSRLWR